jgi:hypothetical protein
MGQGLFLFSKKGPWHPFLFMKALGALASNFWRFRLFWPCICLFGLAFAYFALPLPFCLGLSPCRNFDSEGFCQAVVFSDRIKFI